MASLIHRYIPSSIIAVLCIVCFCLPYKVCFYIDMPYSNSFCFHFFHANIFHLLLNLIALRQFHPRWHTCLVAFVVSSVVSMFPCSSLPEPTCGLSAFLFACYARKVAAFQMSLYPVLLTNLSLAFIPHLNWRVHLLAFFVSFIYWYGYYLRH